MLGDDAALQALEQSVLIPGVMGEELLKRADGGTGGQSHGLDTLAGQVTEQPAAVGSQMPERGKPGEAFAKATQVLGKSRPQAGDLILGHRPPCLMEALPSQQRPR